MQWMLPSVEDVVLWAILFAFIALTVRGLLKDIKRREELNRAIDDAVLRRAEAAEHEHKYRAVRSALKKIISSELSLIRRKQKQSLGAEALNAVVALRAQAGDHPEILREWEPVLEEMYRPTVDPEKAHELLDEALYPETLENEDELARRVSAGLEKSMVSGVADKSAIEAAKILRRIQARNARKQQEELE